MRIPKAKTPYEEPTDVAHIEAVTQAMAAQIQQVVAAYNYDPAQILAHIRTHLETAETQQGETPE